jgi:hypothetical protein
MKTAILSLFVLTCSMAFASRVVDSQIQINPESLSHEYGVIYSNTGLIPAKLQLYCKRFVEEDSWDGTLPGDQSLCGSVDLQVRLSSLGLSLYYVNFDGRAPITIHLYGDPATVPIRAVLGSYIGARAGLGIAAGGNTMVMRNRYSGVWATTGQLVVPGRETPDSQLGMDVGFDFSVPTLEVYLTQPGDLTRPLSSFVSF